jgi:chitinase
MRQLFTTDSSKTYNLSAAPQCPIPDASIPLAALQQTDFVWVQFYDNPGCNVGTGTWLSSFGAWSNQLRSDSNIGTPRLYTGAEAVDAGSGYISGPDLVSNVSQAKAIPNLGNFGGVILWDGSEALANIDHTGRNYLEYAKAAVNGTSS